MTFTPNSLQLALLSAAVLGFRHGFDYDHIAAISDITSVQTSRWRGMRLGLLYALGHAAMVVALGSAVIVFQLSLPHAVITVFITNSPAMNIASPIKPLPTPPRFAASKKIISWLGVSAPRPCTRPTTSTDFAV